MTNSQRALPGALDECGCDDFSVSRRTLLRGFAVIGGAMVTSQLVGDVFTQVAYGAATGQSNVLVVLSLRGGADGLSLVVPHGDPHYYSARPRIGIPVGGLLAKDAMFGLHPAFGPLLPMWEAGTFGAVQAVGLPQPNRSHFAAMEAVEDAAPGSDERRGWINRVVGLTGADDPVEGVQLGDSVVPGSLYGPAPTMSLSSLTRLRLPGDGSDAQIPTRQSLRTAWDGVDTALAQGLRSALDTSARLRTLADPEGPASGALYPVSNLATSLADAARLIRADVGAKVVTVDCGSWDMHDNLGTAAQGPMRSRLDDTVKSLAAFFVDLGPTADRVTVATLSEFGRRVSENGNFGLDHGYGNCMLAMGAGIKGGQVHATWPGLGAGNLIDGDLAVTTDYRSVLAELVASRFPEVSPAAAFPGFSAQPVGIA